MMKFMYVLLVSLTTSMMVNAKTNMNLEGTCKGNLHDRSNIKFTYYSDFDGCKEKSVAGMTVNQSTSFSRGMATGERSFTDDLDIYSFKTMKLTFANSTGNTGGKLTYKDKAGKSRTVAVRCEIRNYEYSDCK